MTKFITTRLKPFPFTIVIESALQYKPSKSFLHFNVN